MIPVSITIALAGLVGEITMGRGIDVIAVLSAALIATLLVTRYETRR